MSGEFLGACKKLGFDQPTRVADLVLKSFSLIAQENGLLLALGYDYWFNPADPKAIGLFTIMLPDETRESFLPSLNIQPRETTEIRKLLYLPDLPIKQEVTEKSINPGIDKRTTRGGVLMGGAGNFNLCTQSLDIVARSLEGTGVVNDLVQKLASASATLSGQKRTMMVECYKYLRSWWGDGDLTKIGLTDR